MIIFRSAAEARANLYQAFQRLAASKWSIRSPFDTDYKCIAWAACRTDRVWWPWDDPSLYWPPGFQKYPVGSAVPVADFIAVFRYKFGYQICTGSEFEFGYQKVAIYADALGATHMARQRFLGNGWLSKLGSNEDIIHAEPADIYCNTYGTVAQYMKRSWWKALVTLCLFRCIWASVKFMVYRTVIRKSSSAAKFRPAGCTICGSSNWSPGRKSTCVNSRKC